MQEPGLPDGSYKLCSSAGAPQGTRVHGGFQPRKEFAPLPLAYNSLRGYRSIILWGITQVLHAGACKQMVCHGLCEGDDVFQEKWSLGMRGECPDGSDTAMRPSPRHDGKY